MKIKRIDTSWLAPLIVKNALAWIATLGLLAWDFCLLHPQWHTLSLPAYRVMVRWAISSHGPDTSPELDWGLWFLLVCSCSIWGMVFKQRKVMLTGLFFTFSSYCLLSVMLFFGAGQTPGWLVYGRDALVAGLAFVVRYEQP